MMRQCPKCGRSFQNTGQEHYFRKPQTIDEYIALQDPDRQADLNLVRRTLKAALPEAEERISWSMPTYWKGCNILHFAASRKHIDFYPGPEAEFAGDLKNYQADKGTIRIPYGKVAPSCSPALPADAGRRGVYRHQIPSS